MPNRESVCYIPHMEILSQLESGIDRVLGRINYLESEKSRLEEELAQLRRDMDALAEQNRNMQERLTESENIRNEAHQRLEALVHKLSEFSAG